MPSEEYVAQVRQRLIAGTLLDTAFDKLLPILVRSRAQRHWSPLSVARRAARRFDRYGVKRVLDVGCGPGKFCIAASFARPKLQFVGVDRRPELVKIAHDLSQRLHAHDTDFQIGDALDTDWHAFDGLYFFNPFAESVLYVDYDFDTPPECGFSAELLAVTERLAMARLGTVIVTYHGMGGPIPSTYDLVAEEPAGGDRIHTWLKMRHREEHWYYIELADGVVRIPREAVERGRLEVPPRGSVRDTATDSDTTDCHSERRGA